MTPTVSIALQTDATPATYVARARRIEELGFDGISTFNDLGYQPSLMPLVLMASATSRVRLGVACLNPFLVHPIEIAGQAAALDLASDGRAYVGLARGAWLEEVGITPDRPLEGLGEAVSVVQALLSGSDTGVHGEQFSLAEGFTLSYPLARTSIPLLLGTWGPRGAALAASVAQEVKLGGSANPDMVARMRRWLDAHGGDDVGIVAGAVTVVDQDGAWARRVARRRVAMYLDVVGDLDRTIELDPAMLARLRDRLRVGDEVGAGSIVPDDVLSRFCFAGTPSDIADQAARLVDAGATRIEFGSPYARTDGDAERQLATHVLPALRREPGAMASA